MKLVYYSTRFAGDSVLKTLSHALHNKLVLSFAVKTMEMPDKAQKEKTAQIRTIEDFLCSMPPNHGENVTMRLGEAFIAGRHTDVVLFGEIELHCDTPKCNGMRTFEYHGMPITDTNGRRDLFISYRCKNCESKLKTYTIVLTKRGGENIGEIFKMGELPPFGPPLPSRLITLIGPDKELFLSGRRCEDQGLGIGAFAYYRRVVENQKNRIFDEVIRVAKKLDGPDNTIANLQAAIQETQFTKAVEAIKVGFPQVLLIEGRNPLTLLHRALSDGLHEHSDDGCLELATSIRLVLAEFAERVGYALKEEVELKAAVSRLLQRKRS